MSKSDGSQPDKPSAAELDAKHQADWNKRVYPHDEAATLAAHHCDDFRALAYQLERELARAKDSDGLVARVVRIDHAYLYRLYVGEKTEPSATTLRKLGVRRIVTYTLASGHNRSDKR